MAEQLKGQVVEELMDRWMNDPSFKDRVKTDPAGALRSCGIEPNEKLVAAMRDVDSGSSAEQLRERIVKWGGGLGGGI
jgi:hypothetical protein